LVAGAVVCAVFGLAISPLVGLAMACIAGVAKELIDLTGHGTPEAADIAATIAGGVITYGALICV